MTAISPQDLVDCTAEVSAIYSVVVRPHASLTAIYNKASSDLDNVTISLTAVQSETYKKMESFGGQLRCRNNQGHGGFVFTLTIS
jgi:hypothetical protein